MFLSLDPGPFLSTAWWFFFLRGHGFLPLKVGHSKKGGGGGAGGGGRHEEVLISCLDI